MRVVAVAGSLVLTLLAAEGVMRVVAPRGGLNEPYTRRVQARYQEVGATQPDPVLSYAGTPNLTFRYETHEFSTEVQQNAHGFRGPPLTRRGPSVFVTGDSFVRAHQVAQDRTACAVLQRRLRSQRDGAWTVHNMGMSSWSAVQYFNLIRLYVPTWKPEAVVIVIYANDMLADLLRQRSADRPGYTRDEAGLITALPPREPRVVSPPSYLGWLARRGWSVFESRDAAGVPYWGVLEPGREGLYDATWRYVRAAAALCRQHGAKLLVAAMPFPNQVGAEQVEPGWHSVGVFEAGLESRTLYPDAVRERCEADDLPYVDLLGALQAEAGEPLFFRYDGHLNERGNEVVGSALAEAIERVLD